MRPSTRHKIDLAKKLLRDATITTDGERTTRWMAGTGRSRTQYYIYYHRALAEIEQENAKNDI